jgi:hypothetical protein
MKKPKAAKTTADKLKLEDPEFVENNMSLSPEEMKAKIIEISKHLEETEKAKANDPDLKSLKEQIKVVRETYDTPLKVGRLKVKFLLEMLEARGG